MNSLNSIIIEGQFGHFTSKKGDPITFTLDTKRTYKNAAGKYVEETATFNIKVGAAVKASFFEKKPQLRIVGRLTKVGKSVVVYSEHIEKKPTF